MERICPVHTQFSVASVVTILGMAMGFIGILCAITENYIGTIVCIQVAIVCDSLDGMIARKTNKASAFGEQLDSLSDFFNFVVSPCIIAFLLGYSSMYAIIAYIIFLGCGISRLSFFNISSQAYKKGKKAFLGMPVPMVTALLYCSFAIMFLVGVGNTAFMVPTLYIVLGFLMISGIKIIKYGMTTALVTFLVLGINIYLISMII